MMEYESRFAELPRFASKYVMRNQMRILRFKEGLVHYIRNQFAGQPVQISHELYKRAAEIELLKTKLRMTNLANPKKRWDERGTQAKG